MSQPEKTPLTDFLIELSHNYDLLLRFWDDRERLLGERGLSEDADTYDALLRADANKLADIMRREHGGELVLLALSPMRPINPPPPMDSVPINAAPEP